MVNMQQNVRQMGIEGFCSWGCLAFKQLLLLMALCCTQSVFAQSSQVVGTVSLLKGVVTAQSQQQTLRTLAKGSEVFVKDEVETAKDSFVVIKMADGGKLTLRPETSILVKAYSQKKGQEEEKLKLIKGGLRAISGLIGKTRPQSVEYETRTTTIGIRGTDLTIRDCTKNSKLCQEEELNLDDKPRVPPGRRERVGKGATATKSSIFLPDLVVVEGKAKHKLAREKVGQIKEAVYFAVFDGGIYGQSADERLDLDAIEACYRPGEAPADGEFHCLEEIPHFLVNDPYLQADGDEFMLFNAFSGFDDKNGLCQIDGI